MLFAAPEPGAGPAARTVLDRLADRGLHVVTTQSQASLRSTIARHSQAAAPAPAACAMPIGAAVLSWELFGSVPELAAVVDDLQRLSAPPPVVVVSELAREQAVPLGLAGRTAASFWLHADSPHFVADQVEWLVRTYALRSQVLGALGGSAGDAAGDTAASTAGVGPAGAGPAAAVTAPAAAAPAAAAPAVSAPAAGQPGGRPAA